MITVFGLGFVGLTTALGFAHLGYRVYGIDIDEGRKKTLTNGKLPFLEPSMEEVLQKHLGKNFFIEDAVTAVKDSEYVFFCVGTPYGKDGNADLTYLFSAVDTVLSAAKDDAFRVIVTKSTIPPGTTKEQIAPYVAKHAQNPAKFGVANNPEFLREGHCWEDFIGADRIVIGTDNRQAQEMLEKLYAPMNIPIKCVTANTGEFVKYLSNTMLATMISYSNEMAEIADTFGDIETAEAFRILHMDKRWNRCNMTTYVYPGCGYGGYCLPKDTNALLAKTKTQGFTPHILENVIKTNDERPKTIAKKIADQTTTNGTVGILGLSFKPGSDDVRDTPAARIIGELVDLGHKKIVAYDPAANEEFCRMYPDLPVKTKNSAKEVYDAADTVALVTAWDEFRAVKSFGEKPVIDCRYML